LPSSFGGTMTLITKILFILTTSLLVNAQSFSGVEVDPAVEESKAQFGVTMMSEVDSIFYVIMPIPSYKLAANGAITSVSYSIFDKVSGTYLVKPTDLERNSNPRYYVGNYIATFSLDNKEVVSQLVKNVSNLVMFLTVNQSAGAAATHYIDFSKLCSKYPGNFLNITTNKTGCN
jgi:hypothetical protein